MSSPLDKLKSQGFAGLSPVDCLAVALAREDDDSELRLAQAKQIFADVGGIRNMARFSAHTLAQRGVSLFDTYRFLAAFELGRRSREAKLSRDEDLSNPEAVFELFDDLRDKPREEVWAALLDVKNRLILKTRLHVGTLDSSVVGTRDVFKEALRLDAASLILVHNHPSGDPTPSPEDIELTRRLREAGRHLDVTLLDHVIIGADDFCSLHRLRCMG